MLFGEAVMCLAAQVHQLQVACEEGGPVLIIEEHVGKTALIQEANHLFLGFSVRSDVDKRITRIVLFLHGCHQ